MAKNNKQLVKQEGKELAQQEDRKKIRKWVSAFPIFNHANETIDKLVSSLADGKVNSNELAAQVYEAHFALGLSTHLPVVETVKKEYRPFLMEMIGDIEREYDCKTASEKILAENIASAYVRTFQVSKELDARRSQVDSLFELGAKTQYCRMLSKELDRASRQYTTALQILMQKKSPHVELNVKAKNAFIAQNQQINTTKKQDETNDPQ